MDQQSSKVAKSLGATSTYLVEGKSAEDMAKDVVALFSGGQQPDITIECSGAQSSIAMGIYATRSGTFLFFCHYVIVVAFLTQHASTCLVVKML